MFSMYSIGYENVTDEVKVIEFNSLQTLLDADVIIIDPRSLSEWMVRASNYSQGKYFVVDSDNAVTIKLYMNKLKTEIATLLEKGKLIFCFFFPYVSVNLLNNDRKYESVSNYSWLREKKK